MATHQSARIYQAAKSFYEVAKPAFDDDQFLIKNICAVIANLALSVELLLKSADAKVTTSPHQENRPLSPASIGSNVRGHNLELLLDNMDQDIATQLQHHFHHATGQELRPLLLKCKDYFIHARYSYEESSQHFFDVSAVRTLAEGLDAALIKGWGQQACEKDGQRVQAEAGPGEARQA